MGHDHRQCEEIIRKVAQAEHASIRWEELEDYRARSEDMALQAEENAAAVRAVLAEMEMVADRHGYHGGWPDDPEPDCSECAMDAADHYAEMAMDAYMEMIH